VLDGRLVFASSLTTGIQAVDIASGAAAWKVDTAVLCDRQWASTIVVGDIVLIPRTDGTLYAIDGTTRRVAWQFDVTADEEKLATSECTINDTAIEAMELQSTPAIAPDGTIIIGTLGGWMYAIENATE
jgi:outer membrane protein assembly factor BamB